MKAQDDTLPLFRVNRTAPLAQPTIEPAPQADADLPVPHNKVWTSCAAARQIQPTAGTIRMAVLRFITGCGADGATDEEIQRALKLRVQTETPRRGELVKLHLVVNGGQTRPTSTGRAAIVWRVTGAEGAAEE